MTGADVAIRRRGWLTAPRAGEALLFPVAALYAAFAVPASVHGLLTGNPLLPGLATVLHHGQELLFGFALAVVAGYLMNRAPAWQLATLFGAWLAARAAALGWPETPAALLAQLAFAALFAWWTAPQFMRGAKKWRNRAFGPVLLALALLLAGFHGAATLDAAAVQHRLLGAVVLLLALLMLLMGGRILAPSAAGAIQAAGGHLHARVQPALEAVTLITVGGAVVAALTGAPRLLVAPLLLAAAAASLLRLLRWRLWACRGRPDLWCLGIGYAWLVAGLVLLAIAWLGGIPAGAATHAITVGALGTLTINVMGRVRLVRVKRHPAGAPELPLATALVAAAAVLRLLAPGEPWGLALAATLWSAAYLALFVLLLRVPARVPGRR